MSFDPTEFPKVLTLYLALSQYPTLAPRIRESMRQELFKRGVIRQEAFEAEVLEKALQSQQREGLDDPDQRELPESWTSRMTIVRDNLTDFYFAYNLPHELFESLIRKTLEGRIPSQDVILSIHPELAPWDMLFAQGEAYEALPVGERERVEHHLKEIRVVLIKAMISDHLEYIAIAREWFNISDLKAIQAQRIGRGKIGGKAAGVMLAESILRKSAERPVLDHLAVPRSWFLGADVFYQFAQMNSLFVFANQKYKSEAEIHRDHPAIQEAFALGRFHDNIVAGLKLILEQIGESPLIVRSSSLLEDSFGSSFAGKYESHFCPNQGTQKQNLEQLLNSIRQVYASVYSPEALLYRKRIGLTDYDERMAILIQETRGRRSGRYFMPDAAGVAFSRNQFRWSTKIDREAGFVRLVWGLGTRAVDPLGGEHPRLVALSHPDLRPESSPAQILRYSQKEVDLIDLDDNAFCTLPVADVVTKNTPYLRWLGQVFKDEDFMDFVSMPLGLDPADVVLTFDGLLRRTTFPQLIREMLAILESAYGGPVDTEFALELSEDPQGSLFPIIYLLQCRPQSHLKFEDVKLPSDIPPRQRLFVSQRMVPDGRVTGVRYAVYISGNHYDNLDPPTQKMGVARLIGRVNKRLEGEGFVLLGPGRWGSNNPDLGISVTYADIYNARALIEVCAEGMSSEPSYGTHFFQDLVESKIYPLALALDDPGAEFNRAFFEGAPNALAELLPEDRKWSELVRVIDIPSVAEGALLELVMDGEAGMAMAYLVHSETDS